MILVTGATGNVGSALVSELVALGERVRVMTRRPEARRFSDGVEVARGDFDDRASLEAAFAGVDRAFLMSAQPPGSAPLPTHDIAAAGAAARAGVRHVVKLSVLAGGGAGDHPIARWHAAAEGALKESGVAWTILRPGRFMSNALAWAPMIRERGEVRAPFVDRPAASIDPRDIAAVARVALTEPGHEGRTYELSGPEALTPVEEAAILSAAIDRPIGVVGLPNDVFRAGLLRSGMSADVVDAILRWPEGHGAEILSTVAGVTGRPARTFAEWARDHVDAFR